MSPRFAEYETTGRAPLAQVRRAAVADFVSGTVLAMLVFPFPIVRASVEVPVFVLSILLTIAVGHAVYVVLTVALLGRTPGMYLFDVGFADARPSGLRLLAFGGASALVFWPQLFLRGPGDPATGVPARAGGVTLESTAVASRS